MAQPQSAGSNLPSREQREEFRPDQAERFRPVRPEVEQVPEREAEQIERKILERIHETPEPEQPQRPSVAPPAAPAIPKDPVQQEIEDILSEDLGPMFRALDPERQLKFKHEGERVAGVIRTMMHHVTVRAKTFIELIRKWLRLIPGVNKFFLEQEAKIKTDQLMALHDRLKPRR